MDSIKFNIGKKAIPFYIGINCLEEFIDKIKVFKADKCFIISDENIINLYREKINSAFQSLKCEIVVIVIKPGEAQKNIRIISKLCSETLKKGCTRKSIIIPFGGGVIGNIGGLLASMLFRGIRLIHLPTTLLAMHDSVTSCKQAVNHENRKNIIGTYYFPEAIFVDITFLKTLPSNHIISGKAELVKNALIFGSAEFQEVEALICQHSEAAYLKMVQQGVAAKGRLLTIDPYEKKEAIIFEYGHTIGHALELYSQGRLTHGEAVAWGMYCAGTIAYQMGLLAENMLIVHQQLIRKLNLRFQEQPLDPDKLMGLVCKDNKRGYISTNAKEVPMLLLTDIGKVARGNAEHRYLRNVPTNIILQSLHFC